MTIRLSAIDRQIWQRSVNQLRRQPHQHSDLIDVLKRPMARAVWLAGGLDRGFAVGRAECQRGSPGEVIKDLVGLDLLLIEDVARRA